MVYFQVDLKYKQFEGKGTGPCSSVTVESWERHDQEEDMHNSAVWKNVKPKTSMQNEWLCDNQNATRLENDLHQTK